MPFLRPERAIRKLLRDSATVQAKLDAAWTVAPNGDIPRNAQMPFIGYKRISGSTEHYLGGVTTSKLFMGTTELNMYATTMAAAEDLAEAVRSVLDGAEPVTVTIGSDTVKFQRLHLTNEDADTFDPADSDDQRVHVITQEYEWSCIP